MIFSSLKAEDKLRVYKNKEMRFAIILLQGSFFY